MRQGSCYVIMDTQRIESGGVLTASRRQTVCAEERADDGGHNPHSLTLSLVAMVSGERRKADEPTNTTDVHEPSTRLNVVDGALQHLGVSSAALPERTVLVRIEGVCRAPTPLRSICRGPPQVARPGRSRVGQGGAVVWWSAITDQKKSGGVGAGGEDTSTMMRARWSPDTGGPPPPHTSRRTSGSRS